MNNSFSGGADHSNKGSSGGQSDYPHLVYGEEPIVYTKNFSDDSRYSYQGKDSSTGERMWVDYGPKSAQQKK